MPEVFMRGSAQQDVQDLIKQYLKDGGVVPPLGEKPEWENRPDLNKEPVVDELLNESQELEDAPQDESEAQPKKTDPSVAPRSVPKNEAPVLKGCRIGIDAGSKTVKVVVVDGEGEILFSTYHRHRLDIRTTLLDQIGDMVWRNGDVEGTIAITGSAGIAVAEMLGLPFVQEVVATTLAVQIDFPEADCVVELGGEDAKVIYLTGGLEQRMNATCAGGTGGFIDTIAGMLGEHSSNMNYLALGANHIYPIASRCAVFAQSDVRPLINAGASKADIAASAHEAVVRQAIGGLACGRPIRGTVVFLGGPLQHIPDLVTRFRRALGLNHKTGIKPNDAHLITAKGAAYYGAMQGDAGRTVKLSEIIQSLEDAPDPTDDMEHLPPLFESEAERVEFNNRHASEIMPRRQWLDAKGPFYLGVDAGSTAVKIAVVDSDGYLVHSEYHAARGDLIKTATKMMVNLHLAMPTKSRKGNDDIRIAYAAATGYGEELLRAGLGIDSGVVETTAHLRAAQAFRPDVSFVFDIGGQDMKAMWVRDGAMSDVVLNEACSSGCGSFVSGIARSLKMTQQSFSDLALEAKSPIDLGTKCTVFMNSRVRHAQKVGASYGDIAAGIAYSVVYNALYRIIGRNKSAEMGNVIIAQGGAFKSDAVLRAFELVSGAEVIRPNTAHIMGAIGAALVARERANDMVERAKAEGREVPAAYPTSTLLSHDELLKIDPQHRSTRCPGCENNCPISIVTFKEGRHYVSGNRCDRVYDYVLPDGRIKFVDPHDKWLKQQAAAQDGSAEEGSQSKRHKRESKAPNVVKVVQALIGSYRDKTPDAAENPLSECKIGLLNSLNGYESLPFWHTLITELGFSVLVPSAVRTAKQNAKSAESVPSESVCQPAKVTHSRMYELRQAGANVLFMPQYTREMNCPVRSGYAVAAKNSVPFTAVEEVPMASPLLDKRSPQRMVEHEGDLDALFACFAELAAPYCELTREVFDAAVVKALAEQEAVEFKVKRASQKAMQWVEADADRHGVILAGRAYHIDPELLHNIDEVIDDLGLAVLPVMGIKDQLEEYVAKSGEPWEPATRYCAVARFIAANDKYDLVALRSFNCGFDAVTFDVAREIMVDSHKPFTELKIDDIVDTAHIRIRLRTLAEAIEARKRNRRSGAGESDEVSPMVSAPASPTPGKTCELAFGMGREDLAVSRSKVTSDLCFTAAALVAHAVRAVRKDPLIETLKVPQVCQKCLVESLPSEVERICGVCPNVEWVNELPAQSDFDESYLIEQVAAGPDGNAFVAPRIGIVGNPLLCFDSFMNENVVQLLESLGCQVVLPDPKKVFVDDVRYFDQLDEYAANGVDHVIYLQSFSCLKGHVQARGAQREFLTRYPNMPITVLDYDPESSVLNRENRIRLAVHAATMAKRASNAS